MYNFKNNVFTEEEGTKLYNDINKIVRLAGGGGFVSDFIPNIDYRVETKERKTGLLWWKTTALINEDVPVHRVEFMMHGDIFSVDVTIKGIYSDDFILRIQDMTRGKALGV